MKTTEATSTSIKGKIGVVLLEDEDLFRDLLQIALSQHSLLEVVGSFADGETALKETVRLRPRVAVLDIALNGPLNGIQVGLLLRQQLPNLGIVILSNHEDPHVLSSVPRESIAGWSYLLKRSVSDVGALARAIQGAASGLVVLDAQLVTGARSQRSDTLARLTNRQREILSLIAQGYTNAAIAQQLVLSEKSVENQINLLYQHLDIDRENRALQPRVSAVLTYLQEASRMQ